MRPRERSVGVEPDVALEEPEPDVRVAVVRGPVGSEVEQQLAVDVVCRGEPILKVILVRYRPARVPPLPDAVDILGAALREDRHVARLGREGLGHGGTSWKRCRGMKGVEVGVPVLASRRRCGILRVTVQLEYVLIVHEDVGCQRHCRADRQDAHASHDTGRERLPLDSTGHLSPRAASNLLVSFHAKPRHWGRALCSPMAAVTPAPADARKLESSDDHAPTFVCYFCDLDLTPRSSSLVIPLQDVPWGRFQGPSPLWRRDRKTRKTLDNEARPLTPAAEGHRADRNAW